MKVLDLIASVNPESGGPIEAVVRGARTWAERGHERHVVTLDGPDDPWLAECPLRCFPLGLRAASRPGTRRRLPWLRYGYTPHLLPWLARHGAEYDVCVVHGLWNYAALGASRALPGGALPWAVYPHGMLDPWFGRAAPLKGALKGALWFASEGRLVAGAGAVLFTAEDERRLARRSFRPYRARERVVGSGAGDVPNEPDLQEAAFRGRVETRGRPFLLYLSRIHPKKGCDLLLRAFAAVAGSRPDLDLVVAGPDPVEWKAELQGLARSLGIAGRVHWPGMLTGPEKWGAFRGCDAFVLPSHQENFGIVVAEALASARPVLVTHQVNIWREIEGDGAGIAVPDTAEGVRAGLERWLRLGPTERDGMSVRARRCYEERFEVGRAANRLIDVLEDVAAGR